MIKEYSVEELEPTSVESIQGGKVREYSIEELESDGKYSGLSQGLIGIASAAGRGFASDLSRLPEQIGTMFKEAGEDRRFGLASPAFLDGVKVAEILLGNRNTEPVDNVVTRIGDKIIKSNQEWMAKHELIRPEEGLADQVAFDIGAGTSSLATALGLLYATRSPALVATFFGARQKADVYKEAREASKTPEEASLISTAAGLIEGGVEMLGGEAWLKSVSYNKWLTRALLRSGIEATEEALQQTGEEAITQMTGVRQSRITDTLLRIGYSATLGFVLGYPAGAITSAIENTNVRQVLKEEGLTDEQISAVISKVTEKTLEDGTVKAEVEKIIDEEIANTTAAVNEITPEPLEEEAEPGADEEVALEQKAAEPATPKTPGLVFGEDIKEAVQPESIAIQQFEERLSEITDLKEKASLAREAKEELSPILEIVRRKVKVPKKGEPEFEEGQGVPSMFKNKEGTPLDEIRDMLNTSDLGINLETTSELIDFLKHIESTIGRLNEVIEQGKIKALTKKETSELRQRIKDVRTGIREGKKLGREEATEKIKSAKDILDRRRSFIRGVQHQFNLTDAELKQINKRDIRLMNNYEFKQFLNDIQAKAADLSEKRQIKNEILFQIHEKELRKVDNLRQYMELPTLEKMSVDQLNKFNQALEEFQLGDEFLSVRKLETVDNTELKGIRTVREAKEILAEKLGVPISTVENIPVSPLDKFTYDTALARKNPFYQFMVDETNTALLEAEQRFFDMEKEIDDLVNKARASRKRSLIEKLIPTDELVFEWLESPTKETFDKDKHKGKRTKEEIANEMTDEELGLASYLQARFAEFRDYLIQHKVLERYIDNYIAHIRRGFLEAWKEDSFLEAFKETFDQYIEDEAVFKILEDDTQNILPLEKYFQFAMRRSGELEPSKNVAKAFKAYTRAMLKKQALDKIVPALDIYAYALSPKKLTPRGLEMDRRLKKFVYEWVNNKKGRKSSLGGILPQGGAVDSGLRMLNGFISLLDLGLNIPVGLTVQIGEQVTTFVNLGMKQYAKGIERLNTAKGKQIVSDNEAFVGKSIFREFSDAADNIGDTFTKGLYFLFDTATKNANKIHLLGSLTEQEWQEGKISDDRLAQLKRDMGRFRHITGASSIFGSTSAGSTLAKYKTWAIPIIETVLDDVNTMQTMLRRGEIKEVVHTREFQELFRGSMFSLFAAIAGKALVDDDDRSFIGQILNKAYRELLTLYGALDPTVLVRVRLVSFLNDLATSLKMIVTMEKYKTKKGYKGVAQLARTLTPRAIKNLAPKKQSKGRKYL